MAGWTHLKWMHMKANVGVEEQWILRAGPAPVCSLKRGETMITWRASLLRLDGICATMLHLAGSTLEQAQRDCERELRRMGWNLDESRASGDATQIG